MWFYIIGITLTLAVGLGTKFVFRDSENDGITNTGLVLGAVATTLMVLPLTLWAGTSVSKANAVNYKEFWNGLETSAEREVITCDKNGHCQHTYDCDSYRKKEYYTEQVYDGQETYYDSEGNSQTRARYRTVQRERWVTRWNSCPKVTHEYKYWTENSFGERVDFGRGWIDNPAEQWKGDGWREPRNGSSDYSLDRVKNRGVPAAWEASYNRIKNGTPNGVTKIETYDNYILAAQSDAYEENKPAIDEYLKKGLLPKVADKVNNYTANKVYFAGVNVPNTAEWQTELQRLNGHLGVERQGDLHLVVVDANKVENPDRYATAMEFYWQSAALGKHTLSKNGIALIIAVNGSSIEWSRGFTGMPVGNESVVTNLREVSGDFSLENVLSKSGAVAKRLFDQGSGFTRVEMKNYEELYDTIEASTTALVVTGLIAFLINCGVWFGIMIARPKVAFFENIGVPSKGNNTPTVPLAEDWGDTPKNNDDTPSENDVW